MVHEFTDHNFLSEVEQYKGVILIDFWAAWCGPCRMQGPIVDSVAEELSKNSTVKIGKVNVDENPNISQRFQIMSIPTIKIFKNGKIVDDMIGLQSKDTLMQRIEAHLKA